MLGDKIITNWLVKASDTAKSVLNVVSSIGPLLISQSDAVSKAYARHQMRLASVEAGKELLLGEVRSLTEIKKELLQRYVSTDSTERLRIKRDVEEISASLRQLKVGAQALNYIASDSDQSNEPSATPGASSPPQSDVTPHWLDKFSELARSHNEPWRENLLARALAAESARPGTVSTRALWLLGTMEAEHFTAFSTLLDLCSLISDQPMIPTSPIAEFDFRPIPDSAVSPNYGIAHLVYKLEDVGLLASPQDTFRKTLKGSEVIVSYGPSRVVIGCPTQDLIIRGVIPTEIGLSIASFCDRKFNPLGKEIFDAWLSKLDKTIFPQSVIAQQ